MLDTTLRIAPFVIRVRSPFASVFEHLEFFYRDCEKPRDAFVDFDIRLLPGQGVHRLWRPQARFLVDDQNPFLPLPADQAAPMFEWGLNWTIASRSLGYVVFHAAVLEKAGNAIILPGFPGAGKSTLCAALSHLRGWRLLSDELAILDPATGMLIANPRPISLKNASIDIVSRFPGTRVGKRYLDTRKGTVAHAAPTRDAIERADQGARPRWLIFPQFAPEQGRQVTPVSHAEAFALIGEQSFNQERMGELGFRALCALLDRVDCHQIEYGSTDDALDLVAQVTQQD